VLVSYCVSVCVDGLLCGCLFWLVIVQVFVLMGYCVGVCVDELLCRCLN
jgi:hypothetical protein